MAINSNHAYGVSSKYNFGRWDHRVVGPFASEEEAQMWLKCEANDCWERKLMSRTEAIRLMGEGDFLAQIAAMENLKKNLDVRAILAKCGEAFMDTIRKGSQYTVSLYLDTTDGTVCTCYNGLVPEPYYNKDGTMILLADYTAQPFERREFFADLYDDEWLEILELYLEDCPAEEQAKYKEFCAFDDVDTCDKIEFLEAETKAADIIRGEVAEGLWEGRDHGTRIDMDFVYDDDSELQKVIDVLKAAWLIDADYTYEF